MVRVSPLAERSGLSALWGGRVSEVASRRPMPYRCRECRKHFSVMSHTLMHASSWRSNLAAGDLLDCGEPEGPVVGAARRRPGRHPEDGVALGAPHPPSTRRRRTPRFDGPVEADETYIGGKARTATPTRPIRARPP